MFVFQFISKTRREVYLRNMKEEEGKRWKRDKFLMGFSAQFSHSVVGYGMDGTLFCCWIEWDFYFLFFFFCAYR